MSNVFDSKFKSGDRVRIINYGSLLWVRAGSGIETKAPIVHKGNKVSWHDTQSGLVGRVGVVDEVINTQDKIKYSINGIKEKHAWYNEAQLELVND